MDGNLANHTCGWASTLPVLEAASIDELLGALTAFVRDAPPEQIRAWKTSLRPFQGQCGLVVQQEPRARRYSAVLEYQMPDSTKRADAILLIGGSVLVIDLKGDGTDDPAYREQVADYGRRLLWYHEACGEENVRVHTILISYGLSAGVSSRWHTVADIEHLHQVIRQYDQPDAAPVSLERFIAADAYRPAPSLVQAVRRFFNERALPRIKRIDEVTDGAVRRIVSEIHATHAQRKRRLILLSGVPGAGKTYVGLRIAHEPFLDDLAEPMANGEKPTAPAVFLSGNGPLVNVLQYELRQAGGEGRVFVRGVKDFVARYSKPKAGAPPHHVLIFDEAQRAWDEAKVRTKHQDPHGTSEPAAFIRFANLIPGWCVVMALIGNGQEIHSGEEGGMALWADAVARSGESWEIVGPEQFRSVFAATGCSYVAAPELYLARSVRFNFAEGLSDWAAGVVDGSAPLAELAQRAHQLKDQGYQLRVTRSLAHAKQFLWTKYRSLPEARFGMLVSSRDKGLEPLGIASADGRFFQAGPWYADPEDSPNSCRRLTNAITEFSAQGLELDHTLVVWGGDFIRRDNAWDTSAAKRYQKASAVKDPLQLRKNAYRVLLTRGREGVLLCCPQSRPELDATYAFLVAAGCDVLE